MGYHWPGNVRELKSTIEYAVTHCKGSIIYKKDLPPELCTIDQAQISVTEMETDDKKRIELAIEIAQGNKSKAARILGISRATFYRKMMKFNIGP